MYTYLIADDETLIRQGTIKKLDPISDQIKCIGEASNGMECLEKAENLNPDIFLIDMQMPVMDGVELLPKIHEKYPGKPIIVISGYKNFDYIKEALSSQAIDYILKPFSREQIQDVVKNAIAKIEQAVGTEKQLEASQSEKENANLKYDYQLIQNLIHGQSIKDTSLASVTLQEKLQNRSFILITLYKSNGLSENTVNGILRDNLLEESSFYISDSIASTMGFLFLLFTNASQDYQHRLCEHTMQMILRESDISKGNLVFGVSSASSTIADIHRLYLETADALNLQLISKSDRHIYYCNESSSVKDLHWYKTDELLFRLEAGAPDEVARLTNELFAWYHTITNCTLLDIKYHCAQISSQVSNIIRSYVGQRSNLDGKSVAIQNIVSSLFTESEICSYYRQYFSNVADMIRPKSAYLEGDTIDQIKLYISRNYMKNLTMEFISSLFYLNRSYCSHMFKQKTGQNFVDYLNKIRIDKSKELLKNPERKMYQVAKAVGYDNIKYYYRVFRKYSGMTPAEYQSKNSTPC